MRLVLDTNIVVSGLLWGGVPRQVLDLAQSGRVKLFTSSIMLEELLDVLERDKFASLLSSQAITASFLMQHYGALANAIIPHSIPRTVRDIDDDIVIATAVAANADLIVTGDDDLLSIGAYQGIDIVTASIAISRLIFH